ncbi:MAG: site-specific integrase [Nitrososphaerales archaeon]
MHYYANEVTKPIPECDELDVSKFLERHCKKGGSWNSYLSTLRQFYAWLVIG